MAPRYGQWRGKALVADPRDGKQRTLGLDVIAQEPDRLRVDVTSSLGAYVGTFASSGGRFAFLSAFEKKFVVGPAESATARELLRLSLEPREAIALLLDSAPPKPWACAPTAAAGVSLCENKASGARIDISRDGEARLFVIQPGATAGAPSGSHAHPAQAKLSPSEGGSAPQERQFLLEKPSGFEQIDAASLKARP